MARTLPSGYTIVKHPKSGFPFVRTPDNKLIPNQGESGIIPGDKNVTNEQLIDNFWVWVRRSGAKV